MKSSDLFIILRRYGRTLRQVLYGFTTYEMDVSLRKERGTLNQYFTLILFGDLLGLPLLPPYYTLRLLPHILPELKAWKRSMLRERDLMDKATDL
ncbi:MAG: hypothetical protein NTW71_12155 [Deltaproteobacteria bacterium]|nr:hypothetical protein [Deltaproteobacteria bacterium]